MGPKSLLFSTRGRWVVKKPQNSAYVVIECLQTACTLDRNDLDNESLGGRNRKCEKNPGRKWQSRLVGSASLALQRGEKAPKTISE